MRIAGGHRPLYHVTWTAVSEGCDVTIRELPVIHLFVPDQSGVIDGARGLIAAKLRVDATTFEVATEQPGHHTGRGA
ncbi:MAG: hypothetical protein H0V73_03980 [Chloroflexi bacterium]|nr:hypothetical protein [Chloroflexota bacterium]